MLSLWVGIYHLLYEQTRRIRGYGLDRGVRATQGIGGHSDALDAQGTGYEAAQQGGRAPEQARLAYTSRTSHP